AWRANWKAPDSNLTCHDFTIHSSPLTFHSSRITFHESRFTHHDSRFTIQYERAKGTDTSGCGCVRARRGAGNRSVPKPAARAFQVLPRRVRVSRWPGR